MIGRWWHSPYILTPKNYAPLLADRRGALIRIEFDDGLVGFADCHPWISCGDDPLPEQLKVLERGNTTTPLLKRTVATARADAVARSEGVSLLQQCRIQNHWLTFDASDVAGALREGYTCFKIKDEDILQSLIGKLPLLCQFRMDFNGRLTRVQFEAFLAKYAGALGQFDFFEDPFPYDDQEWEEVQTLYGVSLACDRNSPYAFGKAESAKVVVVKPAVQGIPSIPTGQRVVVTSYLDHPLGQAAAAYAALQMGCQEVCGLNSHHAYMPTTFSECFPQRGCEFHAPEGSGLGFDSLLSQLPWHTS